MVDVLVVTLVVGITSEVLAYTMFFVLTSSYVNLKLNTTAALIYLLYLTIFSWVFWVWALRNTFSKKGWLDLGVVSFLLMMVGCVLMMFGVSTNSRHIDGFYNYLIVWTFIVALNYFGGVFAYVLFNNSPRKNLIVSYAIVFTILWSIRVVFFALNSTRKIFVEDKDDQWASARLLDAGSNREEGRSRTT